MDRNILDASACSKEGMVITCTRRTPFIPAHKFCLVHIHQVWIGTLFLDYLWCITIAEMCHAIPYCALGSWLLWDIVKPWVIECAWVRESIFEWVWMQLNALYHWFLNEIECAWMPLSTCEHNWMGLSVHEGLWPSIESTWTWLNVDDHVWMTLNQNWTQLNTIKCAWVHVNVWVKAKPTYVCTSTWGYLEEN
jgi:hypothetical protein